MNARFGAAIALLSVAVVAGACGPSPTPSPSPSASLSESPSPELTPTTAPASTAPLPSFSAFPSTSPAPTVTAAPSSTPAPALATVPNFSHIYVILLENKEFYSIVGSREAPYENSLIAKYGLVTNMFAETHPSEPNYIALTSGGIQGVGSDGRFNLPVTNLFDQIEAAGRTWHVYAQNYPGRCYAGSVAGGGDGWGVDGLYARKHNPAISYTDISRSPSRCANITPLKAFDPGAASFELIVPNQNNDMHSSSVQTGDAFLRAFVPLILDSPAFAGSALFITWDEGGTSLHGGGHIATIAVSAGMTPGARFGGLANHYSLLRTIEDAWGMPYLGLAASSTPLLFPYFG